LLPHTPKVVLSDNGSEFEADFARLLEDQGIKRWYTYPKNPKMNAHAERFNRTIQESFVDYHEELLFTDLALFNRQSPLSFPGTSTRVPKVLDSYSAARAKRVILGSMKSSVIFS
jgi:transposase InsO family protein